MNKNIIFIIACGALASLLIGCTKRPPKCSDIDTKEILASIFVRQLAKVNESNLSDKDMMKYVSINNIRKVDYNKERNTYSCSAQLLFGQDGGINIQYESYFSEESGEHMVLTQNVTLAAQISIATYVRWQVERLNKNKTD